MTLDNIKVDSNILRQFYSGFTIEDAIGNNAFSYQERKNKKIFVPPIVKGGLEDLEVGEEIVFSECLNNEEINICGLHHFIDMKMGDKQIFIFDNHNHAFFFWMYGLKKKLIKRGLPLVHIDQHKDTRWPDKAFFLSRPDQIDLKQVFEYTNYDLNVGNFVTAAREAGIFSNIDFINSQDTFYRTYPDQIVLDIDIDIFSDEMNYIEPNLKIERIKYYINISKFITIATSPYFMDQHKAIELIKQLLAN